MSFGVSASDPFTLSQFVWSVYKACRDSVSDFAELAGEVQSMQAVLVELDTLVSRLELNENTTQRLALVERGCRDSLERLANELSKYKSLGTAKKRLKDRMRWGMENVGNLRISLNSHISMLQLFVLTLLK